MSGSPTFSEPFSPSLSPRTPVAIQLQATSEPPSPNKSPYFASGFSSIAARKFSVFDGGDSAASARSADPKPTPVIDPGLGFYMPRTPMHHEPLAPRLRVGNVRKTHNYRDQVYFGRNLNRDRFGASDPGELYLKQARERANEGFGRPMSSRGESTVAGLWSHQLDTRSHSEHRHSQKLAGGGFALPWTQPRTQPRAGFYPSNGRS